MDLQVVSGLMIQNLFWRPSLETSIGAIIIDKGLAVVIRPIPRRATCTCTSFKNTPAAPFLGKSSVAELASDLRIKSCFFTDIIFQDNLKFSSVSGKVWRENHNDLGLNMFNFFLEGQKINGLSSCTPTVQQKVMGSYPLG